MTKETTVTLEMTLHEAKQLVINLGGQTSLDEIEHHSNYLSGDRAKLDHEALYNIFDRLDELVIKQSAKASKATIKKASAKKTIRGTTAAQDRKKTKK